MSVLPSGPISVAQSALVNLIANVPFFQTWTNSGSADAALAAIFSGEAGFPISSVAITGAVLTVTTADVHDLAVNQLVTLEGAALGPEGAVALDGTYTVSTVTPDTFTVATAAGDLPATNVDDCFVLPGALPIAVVMDSVLQSRSVGTGGASIFSGSLDILLIANVSPAYVNSEANAMAEATNSLGSFVQGLIETQDTGDLMVLNSADAVEGSLVFNRREGQDDNSIRFERWRAMVKVTWGVDN
jgi:hypothetical protein